MSQNRALLIAALIVGVLGLVAFLAWPVSLLEFSRAQAKACTTVSERCSWGNETSTMSRAEYLSLSISERDQLVSKMADARTRACGPDALRLRAYQRTSKDFRVYFECANPDSTFVILVRGEDFAHWGADELSRGVATVSPSARTFWNWCSISNCPGDLAELFFIDPGG